jgi:hypothetical protein
MALYTGPQGLDLGGRAYVGEVTGGGAAAPAPAAPAAAHAASGGLGGLWQAVTDLPGQLLAAAGRALGTLLHGIFAAVAHFVAWVPVALFNAVVRNEITIALQRAPWAQSLLALFVGLAYSVLALRAVWELWRLHVARANGEPLSVSATLRGVLWAAVAIPVGPWLCLHAIAAANALTAAVVGVLAPSLGALLPNLLQLLLGEISTIVAGYGAAGAGIAVSVAGVSLEGASLVVAAGLFLALVYAALLFAIFLQIAVRSIDFLLAAFLAPFAALGYAGAGAGSEGMAPTWLANVLILVGSQVLQVTMLYVAVGCLAMGGVGPGMRFMLSLAAVIVALRGPHVLRQYTYHTGTGSMAMSAGQSALRAVRVMGGGAA